MNEEKKRDALEQKECENQFAFNYVQLEEPPSFILRLLNDNVVGVK